MSDEPFLHEASDTVRFWVPVGDQWIGASVGRMALHHRFRPQAQGEDPLETFQSHRADIEAAVHRRLSQGAREPILLREYDLRLQDAPAPG